MARAGITKHQVEKAYQSLMTKGTHPSIDALRVELGNTGSKTTISRYLKELEAEQCVQMEDEALLSEGIKELIAKLASKLHQEANDVVQQSKSSYHDRIRALEHDNAQIKQALESKEVELEKSRVEALSLNSTNETLNSKLSDLTNTLSQSNGKTRELEMVIIEKDKQIQSLNENHQHTRDSLVHYRDSVKEQREQELRQHEQQVQQLQLELRQLNQTMIVKQGDITELNKDNSRLISEKDNIQRETVIQSDELSRTKSRLNNSINELKLIEEKQKISLEKIKSLNHSYKTSTENNETCKIALRRCEDKILILESQNKINTDLLEKLNPSRPTKVQV